MEFNDEIARKLMTKENKVMPNSAKVGDMIFFIDKTNTIYYVIVNKITTRGERRELWGFWVINDRPSTTPGMMWETGNYGDTLYFYRPHKKIIIKGEEYM